MGNRQNPVHLRVGVGSGGVKELYETEEVPEVEGFDDRCVRFNFSSVPFSFRCGCVLSPSLTRSSDNHTSREDPQLRKRSTRCCSVSTLPAATLLVYWHRGFIPASRSCAHVLDLVHCRFLNTF